MSPSAKDDVSARVLPQSSSRSPAETSRATHDSQHDSMMNALGSAFAMAKDPEAIQHAESLVRDYMLFLDRSLQVLESAGRPFLPASRGGASVASASSAPSTSEPGYSDGRVRKGLSAREVEIVRLVARGQTVGQMAEVFNISPHTVRNHLKACYRKVGVHTQIEMVNYAFAQGLATTS